MSNVIIEATAAAVVLCKLEKCYFILTLDLVLHKQLEEQLEGEKVEASDGSERQQDLMINIPTDDEPTGYT